LANGNTKFKKEDGRIDWNKSAEEIERQVRAFFPWPGSYTFWEKLGKSIRMKILKARVLIDSLEDNYSIGKVLVVPQNEIAIKNEKRILGD
jgi:methionyl-tRNA formyltransferase